MATGDTSQRRPFQYSLRMLFVITAVCAVLVTISLQPVGIAVPLATWFLLGLLYARLKASRALRLLVIPAAASSLFVVLAVGLGRSILKGGGELTLCTFEESLFGGAVPGALVGMVVSGVDILWSRRTSPRR